MESKIHIIDNARKCNWYLLQYLLEYYQPLHTIWTTMWLNEAFKHAYNNVHALASTVLVHFINN